MLFSFASFHSFPSCGYPYTSYPFHCLHVSARVFIIIIIIEYDLLRFFFTPCYTYTYSNTLLCHPTLAFDINRRRAGYGSTSTLTFISIALLTFFSIQYQPAIRSWIAEEGKEVEICVDSVALISKSLLRISSNIIPNALKKTTFTNI